MEGLGILITAIIFFFIGFFSSSKEGQDSVRKKIPKLKKKKKLKAGVIPFKTAEELEDIKSGDKALDDHWKSSGIADML